MSIPLLEANRLKDKRKKKEEKDSQPVVEVEVAPEVKEMLQKDIEQAPPEPKVQAIDQPHDSAYVYSQLKGRHTLIVFPTLDTRQKPKGHTIIIVLFILLCVFSAWGTAYELQLNVLNPPQRLTGTCSPPAVIESGGCFIAQVTTDSQGNTHTTLVPAGVLNRSPAG